MIKKIFIVFLLVIIGCGTSKIGFGNVLILESCTEKSIEVLRPTIVFYKNYRRFPLNEEEFNLFLNNNDTLIKPNSDYLNTELLNVSKDSVSYFISLKSFVINEKDDTLLSSYNIDSIYINKYSGKVILINQNDSLKVSFDSLKIKGISFSKGNAEYFDETDGPKISFIRFVL